MIEENKDTSATGTAATEDMDTEEMLETPLDPSAPLDPSNSGAVADPSPDADGASEETFGDADILNESEDAPDEDPSSPIRELEQQLATAVSSLDERDSQYKRIAADFENFRRRTQKEKADLEDQIKCNTITELLPVIDNFERARSQIKPQTDAEMNIHKSYQGVYKQLVDCLKRVGVSPMRSEGEMFDPNLHEAVMREPTSDYEDGIVIEDLMRGYMLGERVLRHAMVKVAAAVEAGESTSPDIQESDEEN